MLAFMKMALNRSKFKIADNKTSFFFLKVSTLLTKNDKLVQNSIVLLLNCAESAKIMFFSP